jgi:hypothetical protein
MHHNKNIVKKPPILHQTMEVKFADGKVIQLNRKTRRMMKLYGDKLVRNAG